MCVLKFFFVQKTFLSNFFEPKNDNSLKTEDSPKHEDDLKKEDIPKSKEGPKN